MTAEIVLAHHPLITALPFVIPAFLVVGLIVGIVVRDRREGRREESGRTSQDSHQGSSGS